MFERKNEKVINASCTNYILVWAPEHSPRLAGKHQKKSKIPFLFPSLRQQSTSCCVMLCAARRNACASSYFKGHSIKRSASLANSTCGIHKPHISRTGTRFASFRSLGTPRSFFRSASEALHEALSTGHWLGPCLEFAKGLDAPGHLGQSDPFHTSLRSTTLEPFPKGSETKLTISLN